MYVSDEQCVQHKTPSLCNKMQRHHILFHGNPLTAPAEADKPVPSQPNYLVQLLASPMEQCYIILMSNMPEIYVRLFYLKTNNTSTGLSLTPCAL